MADTDNGSIFAANRTLEIAAALNLQPCFTPVRSPRAMAWSRDLESATISVSFRFPTPALTGARTDRSLDEGAGLLLVARVHHFNRPRVGITGSTSGRLQQ